LTGKSSEDSERKKRCGECFRERKRAAKSFLKRKTEEVRDKKCSKNKFVEIYKKR